MASLTTLTLGNPWQLWPQSVTEEFQAQATCSRGPARAWGWVCGIHPVPLRSSSPGYSCYCSHPVVGSIPRDLCKVKKTRGAQKTHDRACLSLHAGTVQFKHDSRFRTSDSACIWLTCPTWMSWTEFGSCLLSCIHRVSDAWPLRSPDEVNVPDWTHMHKFEGDEATAQLLGTPSYQEVSCKVERKHWTNTVKGLHPGLTMKNI